MTRITKTTTMVETKMHNDKENDIDNDNDNDDESENDNDTSTPPPYSPLSPKTSRRFVRGASNICLVGANPTYPAPAL